MITYVKRYKHSFFLFLVLPFFFAGCKMNPMLNDATGNQQQTDTQSVVLFDAEPTCVSYPLDAHEISLSMLMPQETTTESMDAPFFQMVQEQTGVAVTYIMAPADNYEECLLECLWGHTYPDLIWGINDSILENQIDQDNYAPLLVLNEYILTDAPNYVEIVSADEEKKHQAVDVNGNILRFLIFYDSPYEIVESGPVIRKDILNQYGQMLPETYDEWETVLRMMQSDVETPLLMTPSEIFYWDYLSSGMGISMALASNAQGFFQVDHQVKYGPLEPEYSEFITRLNYWYQEGLLSNRFLDFNNMGSSDYLLKQANGESGIFFISSRKLASVTALSEIDGSEIALLQDPVLSQGQTSHLTPERASVVYGPGFSVSVDCQHPELAVRFIDYFYSENGIRLTNYGKQGSTYRVEHGDPVYTDAVITQPDLLNEYTSMCFCGVVSEARLELELDNATLDASRKWLTNKDSEYMLPSTLYTDPSVEEDLRANIFDVSTYAQTVTIELIVGERPLSDIPEIQQELKDMGAEKCIELIQERLDAYLLR